MADIADQHWSNTPEPPAKPPREKQGNVCLLIVANGTDCAQVPDCLRSVRNASSDPLEVVVAVSSPPDDWDGIVERCGNINVIDIPGPYDWGRCAAKALTQVPDGCGYVLFCAPSTRFQGAGGVDQLREALDSHHWAYVEPAIEGYSKGVAHGQKTVAAHGPATASCVMWDRKWLTRAGSPSSGYQHRPAVSFDRTTGRPSIGIVITNFKRPERLWEAYRSCINAGMTDIVISSSGVDSDVAAIHERIAQESPNVTIIASAHDPGCNGTWLAGVRASRADYITILHDDDKLLPDFHKLYEDWDPSVDFYAWDGAKHGSGAEGVYITLEDWESGVYSPKILYERLIPLHTLAISPVGGCFPRRHLIEVLSWCDHHLKGDSNYHTRPTMMVGNDMLIWLRAIEKFSRFKYIREPRVSYGHYPGSASYDDAMEHGILPTRTKGLLPIYNRVKQDHITSMPTLLHLLERHEVSGDTARRVHAAEDSWNRLYDMGILKPCHIREYPRDTGSLGDPRRCPFLRDVLAIGMDQIGDNDIIVLTNDDTVLHPKTPWAILEMMETEDCLCALRVSFDRGGMPSHEDSPFTIGSTGKIDGGRDLFAMRKSWLVEHFDKIPDYALGSSDWDSTLSLLMRMSKGMEIIHHDWMLPQKRSELPMGHVYHEWHTAHWTAGTNRHLLPSQIWNRELTIAWQREHKIGWHQRCT